jgi:hypothetical protein
MRKVGGARLTGVWHGLPAYARAPGGRVADPSHCGSKRTSGRAPLKKMQSELALPPRILYSAQPKKIKKLSATVFCFRRSELDDRQPEG